MPQTGSSAVGVAGPGRPSRLRGKQCGTASVGINGRLGAVMSASIQPRRERSPVVITSRSSGSSRKADEAGQRAGDVLPRGVRGARRRAGTRYDVPGDELTAGQGGLVAHGKKFAAVSSMLSEMKPEPRVDVALRRGSPAGTARGAGAAPVWVGSERKALVAPGVWRRGGRCDLDLIVMFAASGA